jgi:hypothetical protein
MSSHFQPDAVCTPPDLRGRYRGVPRACRVRGNIGRRRITPMLAPSEHAAPWTGSAGSRVRRRAGECGAPPGAAPARRRQQNALLDAEGLVEVEKADAVFGGAGGRAQRILVQRHQLSDAVRTPSRLKNKRSPVSSLEGRLPSAMCQYPTSRYRFRPIQNAQIASPCAHAAAMKTPGACGAHSRTKPKVAGANA